MAKKQSFAERMKQRRDDLSSRGKGGSFNFITFKEGTTRIRVLDPGDEKEPAEEVKYIFLGKEIGGFISPRTWGDKCAVYDFWEQMKNSKKDDDKAFAKKFSPRTKCLAAAIKYKDEKGGEIDEEMGVKLAIFSNGQYQDILDFYLDEDYGPCWDPMEGFDIKVKRTGKTQFDTEYKTIAAPKSKTPKKYRGPYDVVEMAKALTPTYKETKEYLEKFLNLPAESESKDQEDKPVKKKKKKRSSDA